MVLKSFFVITFFCIITSSTGDQSRIVNGTNAKEGEFPFAVSLRYNNSHVCGATILSEKRILTAAHCVCKNNEPNDASKYSIQYGLIDISKERVNVIDVSKIHCNNFDQEKLIYDIAVLELQNEIPKGNWSTVKIAKELDTSEPQNGVIIGWGRLFHGGPLSRRLQKMEVDIYPDEVCGKGHNNKHHICFGAAFGGACNGDSGTALLVEGKQVGVASYITRECGIANENYPNVYARVPTYYAWIKKLTEDQ